MHTCPEHPKRDQNQKIYTPKRDDEHPRRFHMGVPHSPPPGLTSVKRRLLKVSVPAFQSQLLKIVCTVYVFNIDLFEFSAAILEKGLFA